MKKLKALLLIASIANSGIYAVPTSLCDIMDEKIRAMRPLRSQKTPEAQEQIKQYQREIADLQIRMIKQKMIEELKKKAQEARIARYPAWRELENKKELLEREAILQLRKTYPIALEKAIRRKEADIEKSQKSIAAWESLNIMESSKNYMTRRHKENIRNRDAELQRLYNELAPIRAYIENTERKISAIEYQQDLLENLGLIDSRAKYPYN